LSNGLYLLLGQKIVAFYYLSLLFLHTYIPYFIMFPLHLCLCGLVAFICGQDKNCCLLLCVYLNLLCLPTFQWA
jgi:hypothetical protein